VIETPAEYMFASAQGRIKLPVAVTWLQLRFLTPGRVNGWLAPAIRGLVLKPLREGLCLLDDRERAERLAALSDPIKERYCRDCARMRECAYGRTFEPDRLLIARRVERGARDGLRGITFATKCQPEESVKADPESAQAERFDRHQPFITLLVRPGDELKFRLLQIGAEAIGLRNDVLHALNTSGKSRGLGPNHVRFELDRTSVNHQLSDLWVDSLPLQELSGSLPSLKIHFDTPLFLKATSGSVAGLGPSRRRFTDTSDAHPTVATLFRESLRTVRRAVNEYVSDDWAVGADMRFLIESAERVKTVETDLKTFSQPRSSSRQERRWQPIGWLGSITAADVPLHLVPYLQWAGRLGAGDSRNCGAGLWRLELG
jgi:hypothetical protein